MREDLSRFGRNYLKVGFYTEMLFPDKGVRFIAINNGVDSANPTDNDFTPFMNIMNEWYAKDTSNKIRAVFKARMQNGKRCSGAIPYGYKRDPEDKNHLLIDEEAADVVRRIYQMVLDGMGAKAIADKLSEDKVLIPSAYLEQCKMEMSAETTATMTLTVGITLPLDIFLINRNIWGIRCWARRFVKISSQRNAERLLLMS